MLVQCARLAPESVLLTDVLAPPGESQTSSSDLLFQISAISLVNIISTMLSILHLVRFPDSPYSQSGNQTILHHTQRSMPSILPSKPSTCSTTVLHSSLTCYWKSNVWQKKCSDFILNSPLGHSTGDIYSQLHQVSNCVYTSLQAVKLTS